MSPHYVGRFGEQLLPSMASPSFLPSWLDSAPRRNTMRWTGAALLAVVTAALFAVWALRRRGLLPSLRTCSAGCVAGACSHYPMAMPLPLLPPRPPPMLPPDSCGPGRDSPAAAIAHPSACFALHGAGAAWSGLLVAVLVQVPYVVSVLNSRSLSTLQYFWRAVHTAPWNQLLWQLEP